MEKSRREHSNIQHRKYTSLQHMEFFFLNQRKMGFKAYLFNSPMVVVCNYGNLQSPFQALTNGSLQSPFQALINLLFNN